MEAQQKKRELFQILQKCKEYLDANTEVVPEHLYKTLEAVCEMFYKWRHSKDNSWTNSARIRNAFNQMGGDQPSPHLAVPLSKSYGRLESYLQNVNTQWNEISNALGIVAPENREIRNKSIEFIITLVETLSIWIQTSTLDEGSFLFFQTLCNFLLNALEGRIESAVNNSLELFSDPRVFLSQTGLFFLDCIQIIQPNSVADFLGNLDENVNRLSAFFILWCFNAFAPEEVQKKIPIELHKSTIDQLKCIKINGSIASLTLAFDLLDIPVSKEECKKSYRTTISKTHKRKSHSVSGTRKRRAT